MRLTLKAQPDLRLIVSQGRLNCRTELCAEGLGGPAQMGRWTKRRKDFPNEALTVTHTEVTERIRPQGIMSVTPLRNYVR